MHVLLGLKGPGSVALSRVTSSMTPTDILAPAAQTPGPTVTAADILATAAQTPGPTGAGCPQG